MKLVTLDINFKNLDNFFKEIDQEIIENRESSKRKKYFMTFDSVKSFHNSLTTNKIQILRIISQFKPESVYQLANMIEREANHVLNDCRYLESLGFIKLEKTKSGRRSLKPVLSFDYDIILADSPVVSPYVISKKAESLLTKNRKVG